jgi:acyl dehydratase
MTTRRDPATVTRGDVLPEVSRTIERLDLIRYAGASGDFNVIHWNDELARAAGLPGVIAHGMFSMALAARMVSAYAGDPAAIKRLKVRFSAMIEPGQTLTARGEVAEVDGDQVLIRFSAEDGKGSRVLSKGEAVLDLARERPGGPTGSVPGGNQAASGGV